MKVFTWLNCTEMWRGKREVTGEYVPYSTICVKFKTMKAMPCNVCVHTHVLQNFRNRHGDDGQTPNFGWWLILKMERRKGEQRGLAGESGVPILYFKLGFYFICHRYFCMPENNNFLRLLLWLGSYLMFLIYPNFMPAAHIGCSETWFT